MADAARLVGCLLGSAVGDSIGLPSERMPRAAIARRWPGPLRQRLVFGRGMVSDDTEHALLTAQALLAAGGDPERFRRALAVRLRWWFLGLPAGVGMATARACLRLWLGVAPARSGVASAGNGAAMRAPIIGAACAHDRERRTVLVDASTHITHADGRAQAAARAVAEAAAWAARGEGGDPWPLLVTGEPAWDAVVGQLHDLAARQASVDEAAVALGCPQHVTGYALHSVPLALYAWLRHPADARAGLEAVVRCGGDTDTAGAIAGALYGCSLGESGLPADWLGGIADWPLSPKVLRRAGEALAVGARPVRWWWPLQPLRNLTFLVVVLGHGFRRLMPW